MLINVELGARHSVVAFHLHNDLASDSLSNHVMTTMVTQDGLIPSRGKLKNVEGHGGSVDQISGLDQTLTRESV